MPQCPDDGRHRPAAVCGIPSLKERDVALLGSDHPTYVAPSELPGAVHDFALLYLGVHMLDNCDLEALAEAADETLRHQSQSADDDRGDGDAGADDPLDQTQLEGDEVGLRGVVAVIGSFAHGIGNGVHLGRGEAGGGQRAGDGVSVEHSDRQTNTASRTA